MLDEEEEDFEFELTMPEDLSKDANEALELKIPEDVPKEACPTATPPAQANTRPTFQTASTELMPVFELSPAENPLSSDGVPTILTMPPSSFGSTFKSAEKSSRLSSAFSSSSSSSSSAFSPSAPTEMMGIPFPPPFAFPSSSRALPPAPPPLAAPANVVKLAPSATEVNPPAQASAKPKPKGARLKSLGLLLGLVVLGLGAALYAVRPSFLFPAPPKPPPVPVAAPLPSLGDMKAKLQDGSRQVLGDISRLVDLPSRGSFEQSLLWCRSVFSLALLGDKPEKLKEAMAFMAKVPTNAPHSQELLKTKAAHALLQEDAALALEILADLPEKDGESLWLLAMAYVQQDNMPKAAKVLVQASESLEPRHQKTLGDIAFAQGDYALAIEAYAKAHGHLPLQNEMDLAIAKSWMHAHRPQKALEQLSAWEDNPPDESMAPEAWALIAHAQLELELHAEAALTLEKLKTHSSLFAEPMAKLFVATGNPKRAAALLEEEVAKRPEDLGLAKQYAQALLLDMQPAQAETFARQLLQKNPGHVGTLLFGATVFQKLGQWESALSLVEKALSLEAGSVEAKLQWAAIQKRLGQFSTAQSFLEKATQESPEAAPLWVARGALFHEAQQLPKAKASYTQALLQQPNNLEALTGLGRIALAEGNMGELKKHVDKIQALNPRSPEGVWLWAHLLWSEGHKQEAFKKLDWALRKEDRHVEFWLSKAQMAMEDKLLGRADEALARARHLSPSSTLVNYWSGLLSEMQEDFKKALSYFQKAAEADKKNPLYLLAQSRALISLNRPQEAAELLMRTMRQHPNTVEAPLLLGRYYQQRYRFKTALPLFEKALAIEPGNVEALRGAADCLLELTQWGRATSMLQRLLRQTPEDVEVIERLGRASFEAGHYSQAVQWYQKALEKEPDNPPVLLNIGWAFKELGRTQDAIQAFKNYLQLEPTAPNRRMLEDEIRFLR